MKNQIYSHALYWTDSILRLVSFSWIIIAIIGIVPFFRYGFSEPSYISWIALFVISLLILFGSFGTARKRWAQAALLVPVFITFIYALDVCYAYIWHARFSSYFWGMLALVTWS
jgi:hypothetical protein